MSAVFPFPVQPVTARRQLRQAVIAALKNADLVSGTAAVSVDSPGDWPYPQEKLPAVCVRSATETKTSINRSNPNFTSVIELDVRAVLAATTAEAAQDAIEALWFLVERAILLDFYVLELVQQVLTVESAVDIEAKGQLHIAGAIGRFRFEVFETFDIAQPEGTLAAPSVADPIVPLTEVTVDITQATSDPPYSAQPGDHGLTITLPED